MQLCYIGAWKQGSPKTSAALIGDRPSGCIEGPTSLWRLKLAKPAATFHQGDLAVIELGKVVLAIVMVDLVLVHRWRIRFELSRMFTKRLQPVPDALGVAVSG